MKIRFDQVSDIMQVRRRDFGNSYSEICKIRKKISLAHHQLRVISSLLEQGVVEWSHLSTVKLKASQFSLGLNPEKMPKNLSVVENKLKHQLSNFENEALSLSNLHSSI